MKYLPTLAGALLGLAFIAFSLMYLLNMIPPQPPPPEGSAVALFMGAFVPTGYLTFVKILELIGGIFVAIPKFRNLGLLILGPIIINILAFHIFVNTYKALFDIPLVLIVILTLYLLYTERNAFKALVCKC